MNVCGVGQSGSHEQTERIVLHGRPGDPTTGLKKAPRPLRWNKKAWLKAEMSTPNIFLLRPELWNIEEPRVSFVVSLREWTYDTWWFPVRSNLFTSQGFYLLCVPGSFQACDHWNCDDVVCCVVDVTCHLLAVWSMNEMIWWCLSQYLCVSI